MCFSFGVWERVCMDHISICRGERTTKFEDCISEEAQFSCRKSLSTLVCSVQRMLNMRTGLMISDFRSFMLQLMSSKQCCALRCFSRRGAIKWIQIMVSKYELCDTHCIIRASFPSCLLQFRKMQKCESDSSSQFCAWFSAPSMMWATFHSSLNSSKYSESWTI